MKFVALVSGGKDSCFNIMECVAHGHELIAIANLKPVLDSAGATVEVDSYMYQSVANEGVCLLESCFGVPLFQENIGKVPMDSHLDPHDMLDDEVSNLFNLLSCVKKSHPEIEAVASGAIFSNYQRIRIEHCCCKLGLTSLAYLWRRDQLLLLNDMIASGLSAIIVKVACFGLRVEDCGKTISELRDRFVQLNGEFGMNVCGEGGEYESFTLDCPLFRYSIALTDEAERVIKSPSDFGPIAYLHLKGLNLVRKETASSPLGAQLKKLKSPSGRLIFKDPSDQLLTLLADLKAELSSTALRCSQAESSTCHNDIQLYSFQEYFCRERDQNVIEHVFEKGFSRLREESSEFFAINASQLLKDFDFKLLMHCTIQLGSDLLAHQSPTDIYAAFNNAYNQFLKRSGLLARPPSRALFFVNSCSDGAARLAFSMSLCLATSSAKLDNLHVQSLSHWAPANIGPYSQSVTATWPPGCQHLSVLAGQIGMLPENLDLPSGVTDQMLLIIRHVNRILHVSCASFKNGV